MKKISTLFKKDEKDLSIVTREIDPDNAWVYSSGVATRKFDGTSCKVLNGELYKRYDCKINTKTGKYKRQIPDGAISCQDPDLITGHHPHWIKCDRNNPSDKYHFEAFDKRNIWSDWTYELCGEKVQGNPEKIKGHELIMHGNELITLKDFTYDTIKAYLEINDIEGVVFHDMKTKKMCKIRKTDFGIKR